MEGSIELRKKTLRERINKTKKKFSFEILWNMSQEVFSVLEITGQFRDATNILIYNSLPGEVWTTDFIEKWINEKNFYLPTVVDNEIRFCRLDKNVKFKRSKLGINEPVSNDYLIDYKTIDMVIVPGIAFDRNCHRLGRGKGHYDKFLSEHKNLFKVGVCFDFQIVGDVPVNEMDIKMDMLVSENDLLW